MGNDHLLVEEIEHAGCKIRIEYDDSGTGNPAEDNDGWLTHVIHTDRNYNLLNTPATNEDYIVKDDSETWHEWLRREHDAYGPILGLYKYEHGDVIIKAAESNPFDCPWDSGQVGWVFWVKDEIDTVGGPTEDEKIIEGIKIEVSEYSDWARGHVYGYEVYDGDEYVGSCWGFVGDEGMKIAIEEAKHEAEGAAEDREEEARKVADWAARDVITIDKEPA